MSTIRGLIWCSDILAAVSAHQLEQETTFGELCTLPLELKKTIRVIGFTYRNGCLHFSAAQAMIDMIRRMNREQAAF